MRFPSVQYLKGRAGGVGAGAQPKDQGSWLEQREASTVSPLRPKRQVGRCFGEPGSGAPCWTEKRTGAQGEGYLQG